MTIPTSGAAPPPASGRLGLFGLRDFRHYWCARVAATLANQMLVIAVGFQVYDIARGTLGMTIPQAAWQVGLIGLAQFVPLFVLALPAGYIADRYDRRWIARACLALQLGAVAGLGLYLTSAPTTLWPVFALVALLGVERAFLGPALTALAPNLVPRARLPQAIALNSLAWQGASIAGPALGGYIYAGTPGLVYGVAFALLALSLLLMLTIRPVPRPERTGETPWQSVRAGLAYVRNQPIILGAMSLDLAAVLLGGATAMLPVFARDILMVGPEGLGHMRAAPAVGAVLVALLLARVPLSRHVGRWMFACVFLFGAATVVFGLSDLYWLSLLALVTLGAADMVSVYVRQSLVQMLTPDAMRGRVASVSTLFISASNELGEFQSGVAARLLGAVGSVVFGGAGAMVVTLLWARLFPALWQADRFEARTERAEIKP
jgi:MFS family permease